MDSKINSSKISTSSGFFSFQIMISGKLIKSLYTIGMIIITLFGIIFIFIGSDIPEGEYFILGGVAAIILGNFIWRIFCEGLIIVFSIHETLVSILNELKRN